MLHAGPDAFATEDALIWIENDSRMAVVHRERAIFRSEALRLQLEAEERGDLLEFAATVFRARFAVDRVRGDE
jgi:hypothetical protein